MGRRGRTKYAYIDDIETEQICRDIAKGRSDVDIGRRMSKTADQVRAVRREFFSTGSLATLYLKSKSLDLARRVVAEANVEEALDVLSRPNIGVLEPTSKGHAGPSISVLTSVNQHHLGGVKVATMVSHGAASAVPTVPMSEVAPDLPALMQEQEYPPLGSEGPGEVYTPSPANSNLEPGEADAIPIRTPTPLPLRARPRRRPAVRPPHPTGTIATRTPRPTAKGPAHGPRRDQSRRAPQGGSGKLLTMGPRTSKGTGKRR